MLDFYIGILEYRSSLRIEADNWSELAHEGSAHSYSIDRSGLINFNFIGETWTVSKPYVRIAA
jgi:hypothetical protein